MAHVSGLRRLMDAGVAAALALTLVSCAHAERKLPTSPAPLITGGWQPADPESDAVKTAANYVVTQLPAGHGALATVRAAQTQVVAGTNIRMSLSLTDGTNWDATVWHKLDGSYALSEAQRNP
jgi:Cystatin domain